ncbi:glycosyl hydrolase 2 galactose-binding domain-containing protein [Microbacterium hydrocarbonoxydans]|uniref:glycoside hydrolase family 2 protein n=1 Tax=Microbacterium hydrocarbonoxydans TaxID=273678 RepID=UPI003D953EB0
MALLRTPVRGPWTLDVAEPAADADAAVLALLPVEATVPGSVHTDLLAAGAIADPYLDRNELETPWIGRSGWSYRTDLLIDGDGERVDLVFDGLDTLATIEVDGVVVAETRNMFRRHRVPLAPGVGLRSLAVTFASPWQPFDEASEEDRRIFGAAPSFLRKMACNFGWDWGPALVTSGIWRPVRLETWSIARLASVRTAVDADAETGRVRIAVDLERTRGSRALRLEASIGGVRATARIAETDLSATLQASVPLTAEDVWWPRGYGDQPLHALEIRLIDEATGDVLDEDRRRIGFRSSRIDMTPDADGTPFAFEINGVPLPIRGFNWIPDDCFPHRMDRARIDARLDAAVEANANLIRVWGGGLYEGDEFYDACDERGLLVWQDFAFACAPYPETPELRHEIEAEARDNVERLMRHPSLVLWNGNNENWLGYDDWDWKERLDGRAWGAGYYLDLLPRIVAEVDPAATYWPGSPYSGTPEVYSNDRAHGVVHLWDGWNSEGYAVFRQDRARFVSEFGWQAPPAWRTLTDAVHDDPLTPTSPGVLHHQKAIDGNGKLSRGLAPYFDEPTDMADWHWAMQLNQARAIRFAVEHFRSLRPLNMGVILWQLNDCWPVASWAVVDSAGRRRPGWYATRDAYAPRLATLQPRDEGLALVMVNDTDEPWSGSVHVRRLSFDGTEHASTESSFTVAPGDAATLPLPAEAVDADSPDRQLLVADVDGAARAWWFFVPDREMSYPEPALDVALRAVDDDVTEVVVTARSFVRDLTVHPDRLGAAMSVDDALVTLLPGEITIFRLRGALDDGVRDALAGDAMRSAGDLVRREGRVSAEH